MKSVHRQSSPPITLTDVYEAKDRIREIATRTPLKPSLSLEALTGRTVYLKMETMQPTGAFKIRGAANAILALNPELRANGVVAASSGNHGRAVAYVARRLRIAATVFLSELVPPAKIAAVECLGAKVIVGGKDQDAAIAAAHAVAMSENKAYICPFDDPFVIAGQATIGLEVLEDCPDLDTMIVQVSGGGLAAGIGMVLKTLKPGTRVIGVTMEAGAAMYHSLEAGRPVEVEEVPTLADALQGGVLLDNRYTFDMCRQYLDKIMLISEEQIAAGMRHAFQHEHLVLEGAGACGISLLLGDEARDFGQRSVAICSGDNIDCDSFLDIVSER
jgi:threonine dehydratase